MRTRPLVLLLPIAALAATSFVLQARGDPPASSQPALVALAGAHSRIDAREIVRVTDPDAWTALWLRHRGADPSRYSAYYNEAEVPAIDFGRCMVLAVFQGSSTNSAGVDLVEVEEDDAHIVARYDDRSYQTAGTDGSGGAQAVTAWGLFVLPRSNKPLVVEENVQGLIGHPPQWKRRAEFEALPPG